MARARIVLGSADRLTVAEIARRARVGLPAVWRQRRFAEAGVDGLLRDASRKPAKRHWGKAVGIVDRGHERQRRERTHAWNGHQPMAHLVPAGAANQLAFERA